MDILDRYNRVLIIPMHEYKFHGTNKLNVMDVLNSNYIRSEYADLIVARKVIAGCLTDEYYVLKNRYVTPKVGCNIWINRDAMIELLKRHEYYSHDRK